MGGSASKITKASSLLSRLNGETSIEDLIKDPIVVL